MCPTAACDRGAWMTQSAILCCLLVFSDLRFLSFKGKQIFAAVYLVESIYPLPFCGGGVGKLIDLRERLTTQELVLDLLTTLFCSV